MVSETDRNQVLTYWNAPAVRRRWRRNPSLKAKDNWRTSLEQILVALTDIEAALNVSVLDGPFFIDLEAETRACTKQVWQVTRQF